MSLFDKYLEAAYGGEFKSFLDELQKVKIMRYDHPGINFLYSKFKEEFGNALKEKKITRVKFRKLPDGPWIDGYAIPGTKREGWEVEEK